MPAEKAPENATAPNGAQTPARRKGLRELIFGPPRDVRDPKLFHKISLVAFLAWVGLGADGLSSSAYGPDETFRALAGHPELAVFLALATAVTVMVISYAYSMVVEHFPHGGGGYVVATKLLGAPFGVISGSALLVDYVLTITTSIASGADQIFSFLPAGFVGWKLVVETLVIAALIVMNLRGVKESIKVLVPIFMLFIVTHAIILVTAFLAHAPEAGAVAARTADGIRGSFRTLGMLGVLVLVARAYSRGAGTYTGIEAVSNGVQLMREPRVATAKRTMLYMALSLAVTAGGIILAYLLLGVHEEAGKTMNAVLIERLPFGRWFTVLALVAEAALLFVAAQTGFIDGPRVMANMAVDSWIPHRFSSLSDRLTMHYGVLLMGGASLLTLFYTRGNIDTLVTMYSINVFITFSLTELGMVRHWITHREDARWKRVLPVHLTGLTMCVFILCVVVVEKFRQGAWITILVTSALVALCALIRRHYRQVEDNVHCLSQDLGKLPLPCGPGQGERCDIDVTKPTAVLLTNIYGGVGIHALHTIFRLFPDYFHQFVFVSVGVINTGNFKGADAAEKLEAQTRKDVDHYVELAHHLGYAAEGVQTVGTEPAVAAEQLCTEVARRFPRAVFFGAKLVFPREQWYHRFLHNETSFAIQRRLQHDGLSLVVLPVRAQG